MRIRMHAYASDIHRGELHCCRVSRNANTSTPGAIRKASPRRYSENTHHDFPVAGADDSTCVHQAFRSRGRTGKVTSHNSDTHAGTQGATQTYTHAGTRDSDPINRIHDDQRSRRSGRNDTQIW